MTTRIYETDGHCRRFEATVTACEPRDGGFRVELSHTAFFPEGGGQYADTGCINGVPVTDVQLKDGRLWHYTYAPLVPGNTVTGEIDWEQRFSRMQHHSGEHIVSGLVHALFGLNNVGFHLGNQDTTLDFDGELSREQLMDVERRANAAVAADLPVSITFPAPAELEALPYRSKKELSGEIRIVTIPGVDVCACCAPHVTTTGEIGGIKLLNATRYKGGVRVHMLCGNAAFAAFEALYREATAAAAALSAKTEGLSGAVERLLTQKEELGRTVTALRRELAVKEAAALPQDQPVCARFLPEADNTTLQALVNAAVDKHNCIGAAFSGDDVAGWVGIVGSNTVEIPVIAAALRERLSGHGGGRDGRWQGRIAAPQEAITALLAELAGE